MNYLYGDYGFSEFNPAVIDSKVDGIPTKVIGDTYTVEEEFRDMKRELIQHIENMHVQTRQIVNDHTTVETNRAIATINANTDADKDIIVAKINEAHNYVINTVKPAIDNVGGKVDGVRGVVNSNNSILSNISSTINKIWNQVS